MIIAKDTVVGYRVLTEPQKFSISQEYAGASMTVEVPAGRYPVVVNHHYGKAYIVCSMPGVVTNDSFWNHIGAHGSMDVDRHKGQEHTYHWQPYDHSVAWDILKGVETDFELAPGVEAREIFYEYDGREGSTAGLFVDGVEVDAR